MRVEGEDSGVSPLRGCVGTEGEGLQIRLLHLLHSHLLPPTPPTTCLFLSATVEYYRIPAFSF